METQQKPTPELNLTPMTDLDINQDGVINSQDIKQIWRSKTFRVNLLAIIAFGIQLHFGYVIDPAMQAQILGVVNIILRTVTSAPVKWR